PRPGAGIDLCCANPVAQRLCVDVQLPGNPGDRALRRDRIATGVQHEPDGLLADLLGILAWCGHDSILPRIRASTSPGAPEAVTTPTTRKTAASLCHRSWGQYPSRTATTCPAPRSRAGSGAGARPSRPSWHRRPPDG